MKGFYSFFFYFFFIRYECIQRTVQIRKQEVGPGGNLKFKLASQEVKIGCKGGGDWEANKRINKGYK
jgi:hypothetical protein